MTRSVTALLLVSGLACLSQAQTPAPNAVPNPANPAADKSGAYYNFAMGRLYAELAAGDNARNDYVAKAIEHYQEALKDDPSSDVVLEELTDVYIQTGRLRDAVNEAQDLLAKNPDNLGARRMLGRIYTRMIGDAQQGRVNQDMLQRATEQYEKITQKDPKDAESWVMLGRLYGFSQKSVDSEKAYNNALKAEPDNEDALMGLAQLYANLGDTQRAIEKLKAATEKNPSENTLLALASAYENQHDYKNAAAVLERAVDQAPDSRRLRRELADALFFSNQWDKALEAYADLAKDNPRDATFPLRMSEIYRAKRDYAKAQEALNKAKEIEPDDIEVLYDGEVKLLAAEGKTDQAITALNDLLQKTVRRNYNPQDAATRAMLLEELGALQRDAGQYPQAIDAFRQIGSLNGQGGARVSVEIVETYREAKDLDSAQKEADLALKKFPNERMVVLEHAQVLSDRGKADEAISEVRGLLKGDRDRDTLIALARLYETGKKYNEEAKTLDEADKLSTDPADKENIEFLRGAMYEREKKYDLSEAAFRKVLAMNPDNAEALNYLGYMLANRGLKLEEAGKMIQRALELEPDNGAFLDSLGWVYYQQGKYTEAEAPLLRAIQKIGTDPTVHDHLGDVYLKMGKTNEAISQWQTSLQRYQAGLPSDNDPEDVAKITRKLETARVRLAKETRQTK
ncbi:MAG TPA: tetratricopeptide repeat protein [Bryobacteraceae bacterium]|nr:tetratricopeptide repeat protein [Bryobacteraceae bacterium]